MTSNWSFNVHPFFFSSHCKLSATWDLILYRCFHHREVANSTSWVHSMSSLRKIHPAFVPDPRLSTWCTSVGSSHSQPETCTNGDTRYKILTGKCYHHNSFTKLSRLEDFVHATAKVSFLTNSYFVNPMLDHISSLYILNTKLDMDCMTQAIQFINSF